MKTLRFAALAVLAVMPPLLPGQDDRDRTTPVGSIWLPNQTTADLLDLSNAGWRFTDLNIESTSPWRFTVAAVQNTGSYQKTWWYVVGVTLAQLTSAVNSNTARIVDIEPYDDNGTTRFVAILISNTGADAKSWAWFVNQTSGQVSTNVAANNGRLTCFRRYSNGGVDRWATVMIANTGPDARSWGYLFGASAATITQNINQNGNRIYGIDRVGTDSYDVILIQQSNFAHWFYFDVSGNLLTTLLQQNIGRIVDIERRTTLQGPRYTVSMIDNANTLERLARQQFLNAPAASLGDYGFWLKEVNGPILAQMRPDTTFEPASTMKTVYHVHAMRRIALMLSFLNTSINKPLSCGVPGYNQTIEQTLSEMMEVSDNMSTLAISNWYGLNNIQTTATNLGMNSTSINFTLGCSGPSPESTLTLRDLSTLHEAVANGFLLHMRGKFYELMAESLSFPSWNTVSLDSRINSEAAALGMPVAVRTAFKNALHIAYKPGSIGWPNPGVWTYYCAEGGWMSVPFKNASGVITPREYTFGVFNCRFTGVSNEVAGRRAMGDAELELVWDRVKAAMATWNNFVPGQLVLLPGAGCPGSNGTPSHTVTGTPEIGSAVNYRVNNAPGMTICVALFGFNNQFWNGAPLPLNLGVAGAPGCNLRIDAQILVPEVSNFFGTASSPVSFPNNSALVGAQLYSQYLVLDPPANTFGFTISGAMRTTVGGYL